MTFTIMLLAVVGFVAYRVTSPEQREHLIDVAIPVVRQWRIAAMEPGPEYEAFCDALRARMLHLIVIPAIVLIGAEVFIGMRFGAAAMSDPASLVAWGASLGTLTTNGGWWRLVTSTIVHTSMVHLLVGIAVLVQVGRILERLVGRLTVAAVYLSAGIFTGLVNLSSQPLAVTTSASGALFGLYGLLIALLAWQAFHDWRGTRHPHTDADAETNVSAGAADAGPQALHALQLQLDRPPMETWTPAVDAPPTLHVKAEAGPPPLDASWGLPAETPGPVIETWRGVAGAAVETWEPAIDVSSPAIATLGPAAETSGPALAGPPTAVPLVAMKRLGVGAGVFLAYSALSGFAGRAEFTGLFVGFLYGLVLARRAGEQEPTRRQIGFVTAAAGVVVIVCAVALRNIADVKPEIARVLATEERTAASYRTGFDAFRKGRMTAEALAQLAEQSIMPELLAEDARLKALTNVPPDHQPIVADAREYLRLRCVSWRAHADALRRTRDVPQRAPGTATDASWRLQAEARFRSNRVAMGSVEGAERASQEAFQRIKLSALP